ncbi:MAG: M20 family peptidase [Cupriavidus sp.]|nr:MAG: M20 family peptidase [Cupriavidus sp.]
MIDAIDLTRELVRIPSLNPPGDEERCARYLAGLLADAGFAVRLDTFGPRRFNLTASLAGSNGGKPPGFSGHLDTVPLGAADWRHDPFGAEIVDGKLFGRGSSDMKAGIAAFVVACWQARDALRDGPGVRLLLTGGEETGCDGARAMAAGGQAEPLSVLIVGEPTGNYPCIGHKGALWLEGVASGKTAHGSMPERGDNAIYKATRAIEALRAMPLDAHHALMGRATLNVGTFHAGLNVNSVPDRATFTVDMRTVPGMRHECLCTRLRDLLGGDIALAPLVDVPPLHSDPDDPVLGAIFAICARYHHQPLVPRAVPFFTDGSTLRPLTGDPPTVILGPGEPAMAHQTDEYCHTARIDEAVQMYRAILERAEMFGG